MDKMSIKYINMHNILTDCMISQCTNIWYNHWLMMKGRNIKCALSELISILHWIPVLCPGHQNLIQSFVDIKEKYG